MIGYDQIVLYGSRKLIITLKIPLFITLDYLMFYSIGRLTRDLHLTTNLIILVRDEFFES